MTCDGEILPSALYAPTPRDDATFLHVPDGFRAPSAQMTRDDGTLPSVPMAPAFRALKFLMMKVLSHRVLSFLFKKI